MLGNHHHSNERGEHGNKAIWVAFPLKINLKLSLPRGFHHRVQQTFGGVIPSIRMAWTEKAALQKQSSLLTVSLLSSDDDDTPAPY